MTAGDAYTAYSTRKHFGSLDGLRCLAIAAVLYHHSPIAPALYADWMIAGRGFLGVDLFFVISGFLITSLLLRERAATGGISLRGFYWRRSLRILPLYLLVVTAIGGYYVLVKGDETAATLWPYYYVFLANFLDSDIGNLGPTWSLSVEEQYYLIWPLLLILTPRRALLPLLAVLVAVNVAGIMGLFGIDAPEVGPLRFALPTATYAPILMGSALAVALDSRRGFALLWRLLGHRSASLVAVVALALALLLTPEDVTGLPNLLLHTIMMALVAAVTIREDHLLAAPLRLRPVVRVGMVSYGIYLLHLPVLHVVRESAEAVGLPLETVTFHAVYWLASYAVAELSFRYFEKPFLDLRHRKKYRSVFARV